MKKLLAIALILSLLLCALPALADQGEADVVMEGETYHLTLTSVDIVDGQLTVAIEGFGDTLRWGANGPMIAALPEAHYGDEIVNVSTINMNVGAAFTFVFERDELPDGIWMDSFDEGVDPVLIWQAGDAEAPEEAAAAPIPEALGSEGLDSAMSLPVEEPAPALLSPSVGDIVTFGHYEQDNDEANGPEEIEWIVLRIKNGGATLISRYALDAMAFSEDEDRLTWDVCTLREWLNGPFIDAAFSEKEQSLLKEADVPADRTPGHEDLDPGQDTRDRVYLLSYTESELWFASKEARCCQATDYALTRGALVNDDTGGTRWHLRSPGNVAGWCASVDSAGNTSGYGSDNSDVEAIRPVITLAVDAPDSPEITPVPSPTPAPAPSPTPVPDDLAALNALHVQASEGGDAIGGAACDGDVIVAYYTSSGEDAIPRKLTVDSGDDWDFPREYRAADYASARWAALIFPTYENVGFYGQYGPANRTITWLALADLQTGRLYREKIAAEEPPETIEVQTFNGIPIRSGASGEYRDEEAFARLTELVEAAR